MPPTPDPSAPTISIVMPVFDKAGYVAQSIVSAQAQTWHDWELIAVDDGSSDNSGQVIMALCEPRVRYLRQENAGASAARNSGIQVARGAYITFLDADDAWEPAFLARCHEACQRHPSLAGAYTRYRLIDQHGNYLSQYGGQVVAPGRFREKLWEGHLFAPHCALIATHAVCAAGCFDTSLSSAEDWDLWIRIAQRQAMIGLPDALALYRVFPGTLSTDFSGMHANRLAVLRKYLGPPEGNPQTWPDDKRRAYGYAYRTSAFDYLRENQLAASLDLLEQAIRLWPPLLGRLDTAYELACGAQPRGERGRAQDLNLAANGKALLNWLGTLYDGTEPPGWHAHRGRAYGNAYLALAMLSDQAGAWSAARGYLVQALQAEPRLAAQPAVLRRLLKLLAGQWVVSRFRPRAAIHR